MGLFKSKAERKIERTIQVKKALAHVRKQITSNIRFKEGYIKKARTAKSIGSKNQYEFLKKAIKKTESIKIRLERQLLALETAVQIKDQAEGQQGFASAMGAISKSISEAFGTTNFEKTQVDFEKAVNQAESMEERLDTFLDITSESMFGYEGSGDEELISDNDIDRMISEEVEHEEGKDNWTGIDDDIDKIQKELNKVK